MRHAKRIKSSAGVTAHGFKSAALAALILGFAPLQAQAAESCNAAISIYGIKGPPTFFEGDNLTLKARIGAGQIRDSARTGEGPDGIPYIDFTGIGYGVDCGGKSTMDNLSDCKPVGFGNGGDVGHDIVFEGVTYSDCPTDDPDELAKWPGLESNNIVPIPVLNGVVRQYYDPILQKGEACNVDVTFKVVDLYEHDGVTETWVTQALGVPFDNYTPGDRSDDMVGTCSNGLGAGDYAKAKFEVQSCGIEVEKQVSLDGETWFDADDETGAPTLGPDDGAFYRLVVKNTGTAGYVGNLHVVDANLGIDTMVSPNFNDQDEMIIGGPGTFFEVAKACAEQLEIGEGLWENTASVEGTCRAAGEGDVSRVFAIDNDKAFINCLEEDPRLATVDIEKSTNGVDADLPANAPYVRVGEEVTWEYVVTNTGNEGLTIDSVIDDDAAVGDVTASCGSTFLASGASTTCTAKGVAGIDLYSNTATVKATSDFTSTQVQDSDPSHYFGMAAIIELTKTPSPSTFSTKDEEIIYTFTVQNPGNVPLTGVKVEDPLQGLSPIDCGGQTELAVGASMNCTATYKILQADLDRGFLDNTATARGTAPNGDEVSDQDSAKITTTPMYGLGLVKTASPLIYTEEGEGIDYSYVLTNTGKQTLYPPYSVSDDKTPVTCADQPASLAPGASVTCSASYMITAADVTVKSVTNTAQGKAKDAGEGDVLSNEDSATVDLAAIQLVKTPEPSTYSQVGDVITYTFAVSNVGNAALSAVTVTDPMSGLSAIDCGGQTDLAAGASMNCTATYSVMQSDLNTGQIDNTATATGQAFDGTQVIDEDSATVTTTADFSLLLLKTADPQIYEAVDEVIDYTYLLTNDGSQTVYAPYGVVDDKIAVGQVFCPGTPEFLDPGDSVECTASYTITADDINARSVTNKATGSAQDSPDDGNPVLSNEDTETVVYRGIELQANGLCVNDVPWAFYDFSVFGIDGYDPSQVTYTWVNVTDNAPDEIIVQPPIAFTSDRGYLLWPGAGYEGNAPTGDPVGPVDPDWPVGNQWPGWKFENGVWVEEPTPATPELVLRIQINPTTEMLVTYPSATPVCTAAPKPLLEVVKTIVPPVYNDDGTLDVTYNVTVSNSGGQDAIYDLEDTFKFDEALVPLEIVENVSYVAGTENDQDGTLGALTDTSFPGPVSLVSDETLGYGFSEGFNFTLRFGIDGEVSSVEGANCLTDDDKESNTGLTNYVEVLIGDSVEDFDEVCDSFRLDPEIEIVKEVSIDGENFYPAISSVPVPSGAFYRLTVKNLGNVAFDTVTVTDSLLQTLHGGAPDYSFGPLAAFDGDASDDDVHVITYNGVNTWYVLDASNISGEGAVDPLCANDGDEPLNTATAAGDWGDPLGGTETDFDTAQLFCEGDPMLELVKRVGVEVDDGVYDMQDADIKDDFPLVYRVYDEGTQSWVTSAPVAYDFRVTNIGTVDLSNVEISDPDLFGGLVINVGDLAVGETKLIQSGFIDAVTQAPINLVETNVCKNMLGPIPNSASADGSSDRGDSNTAMDGAGVLCVGEPSISIEKLVSVDGVDYFESLTAALGDPAYWKIIVTNDGSVNLENVNVTDTGPGPDPVILDLGTFDLAVGETKTFVYMADGLDESIVEVPELYEAGFCSAPFPFSNPYVNTASASGDAASDYSTNGSVSMSDTASYQCLQSFDICKDGGGKPGQLTMFYNGTYDSDNAQNVPEFIGNGYEVIPDISGPIPVSPVTVKLYDKDELEATHTGVTYGTKMIIDGKWRPDGGIPPNIKIEIIDPADGSILQTVKFHGSCSAPLLVGDEFGGMTISGFLPKK